MRGSHASGAPVSISAARAMAETVGQETVGQPPAGTVTECGAAGHVKVSAVARHLPHTLTDYRMKIKYRMYYAYIL